MPASPKRATLATVAASAGVSVATVSKVLNGRGDVSPVTRSLVESLLEQYDYVAPPG
ncbi:LacI family DNA-binding transcriptional regulator [Streptosporangium sp. CA-115845]|uniref:LacI family DNA-binding transcriptional regulator n=1 Tax=Streptosporangium sp. CA-115845 TaxID=3240071 RepID=UPI003D92E7DE